MALFIRGNIMKKFFIDQDVDAIYNSGVEEATKQFVNTLIKYRDAMQDDGLTEQAILAADMIDKVMRCLE